jgi:hypothetical protein
MKLSHFLLLLLLLWAVESGRHFRGRGTTGARRGVQRAGSYLGNSVANLIKMFREEPEPMPKNYKRKYEPPPKEEYTLYGRFKNGLMNFIFLGYALLIGTALVILYKVYWFLFQLYCKYRLSIFSVHPAANYAEIMHYRRQLDSLG